MEKFDPNRSLTPSEFRYFERMSPTKYHELKRKSLGPKETNVDGMLRITPADRATWHAMMDERAQSEATRLEAERKRAQAAEAGRIAAQSPRHVSRRQSQPKRA
jgi:hypothetical protein